MGSADTDRMYMCIDLKSFYASVECADLGLDPFTTPLVVADGSRGKGAITLAISPALKKLGVKNRSPAAAARRVHSGGRLLSAATAV